MNLRSGHLFIQGKLNKTGALFLCPEVIKGALPADSTAEELLTAMSEKNVTETAGPEAQVEDLDDLDDIDFDLDEVENKIAPLALA